MTVPEIPRRQPTSKPIRALVDDGIRALVLDDLEAIAGYMRTAAKPDSPLFIRAGEDAEPAELAHLRYLTPSELRSVRLHQMTEKGYLSVLIVNDGYTTIEYDEFDQPAAAAAERVRQLVQNLDSKPNWRRYYPWARVPVSLWLAALALGVGSLFVRPAALKWLLIGVELVFNLGAVGWSRQSIPLGDPGIMPYTREELAQRPVPPNDSWGRFGVFVGIGGIVVAVVFGVLALVLH